jgi:hypothetical protein
VAVTGRRSAAAEEAVSVCGVPSQPVRVRIPFAGATRRLWTTVLAREACSVGSPHVTAGARASRADRPTREEHRLQHAALEAALDVLDRGPATGADLAARLQIETALQSLLRRIWPYLDELDDKD